jgi:uncharacterized protein
MKGARCAAILGAAIPGVALLLVVSGRDGMAQAPAKKSLAFDLYEKGVQTATLRDGKAPDFLFTVRRRDWMTGVWGATERVSLDSLSQGSKRLPGSLRAWAKLLPRIAAANWDGATVTVLLSLDSAKTFTYIRHRSIAGATDGNASDEEEWALQDGGLMRYGFSPLDLIVDPGNTLVAAIDPSDDNVLVKPGAEARTTVRLWRRPQVSPAKFGVVALPRAMVAMPDSVHLATYIYLPADSGGQKRYPVILTRTPYNAAAIIAFSWPLVARGYAVVAQDVRGRYASEGQFEPDLDEIPDGDETLTWIAHQPWSNGVIGMAGGSYPGHTQWEAAAKGNPALKALVPVVSMGTPHNDMPYTGGAFTAGGAQWTFGMSGMDPAVEKQTDWATVLKHRPILEIDSVVMGRESPIWRYEITHTAYDSAWKAADWLRNADVIAVPALHISGWYDDDHPGTLANWAMMEAQKRPNQRLILGGWRHGINRDREINGVHFGVDDIRPDLNFLMFEWYERFLKGIPNGIEKGPRVEYFSVGDNAWHTATAWPPANSKAERWYLHSSGNAASAKKGSLSITAPAAEAPDPYRYDPENPTPDLIDVSLNEQALPNNYAGVDARPDVAVYDTPRLKRPLRIAGPLEAVVFASSSAKDTDWMLRLSDVDSAGNAYRFVTGLVRARYRTSMEVETPLTPGAVEQYHIRLRSIAATIKPGHRLRVSVFSAASGYIFPNSNTGEDEATVTRTVVASQQIYHTAQYPSYVLLPVVVTP